MIDTCLVRKNSTTCIKAWYRYFVATAWRVLTAILLTNESMLIKSSLVVIVRLSVEFVGSN
ncbi:hypothetical protein H4Q26_002855, partial [Puccinia striiformis f. sp. tritici PST-130]